MVVRRNRATHWLPTTGTLFGCGPNASQSTLHSATRWAGAGDEHLGAERLSLGGFGEIPA